MTSEQWITIVGGLIMGLIGAPTLLQWVKNLLKVEDSMALLVVYITSAALGAVALFITGELQLVDLTWANWAVVVSMIVTAATAVYRIFMKKTPT